MLTLGPKFFCPTHFVKHESSEILYYVSTRRITISFLYFSHGIGSRNITGTLPSSKVFLCEAKRLPHTFSFTQKTLQMLQETLPYNVVEACLAFQWNQWENCFRIFPEFLSIFSIHHIFMYGWMHVCMYCLYVYMCVLCTYIWRCLWSICQNLKR